MGSLPHHLEREVTRRSAAMRAEGPAPIDESAARWEHWQAEWAWAYRDPEDRRRMYVTDCGRWPPTPRREEMRPLRDAAPLPVLRLGQLVRRLADGAIGRVVGLDGRRPIVAWRGATRGEALPVSPLGGAYGVVVYHRRAGEAEDAAWRVASRALVGDPRWGSSPRRWVLP